MAKIDPETNKQRVKDSMERRGTERINLYMPKGTQEKIKALGYRPSTFAKTVVLDEIRRLEELKEKH